MSISGITHDESFKKMSAQLKKEMSYERLQFANGFSLATSSRIKRDESKGETTELNQLKPYFYHSSPNGGSAIGLVVLDKIKFENDLIHLWLVNKTSERSGEIWVDVKTRKVVKAMEDGDITFPREKETEKQATE